MQFSSETKDLFEALSKAQGEMSAVPFDKTNPHFNSKYASLAATQEMYRVPLSKHGLALIQIVSFEPPDHCLTTVLTHSSGQSIVSKMKLMLRAPDMQALGSAVTYAKRYAAQSILGICGDDDDDANAATAKPPGDQGKKPQGKKKDPPQGPPVAPPKEQPAPPIGGEYVLPYGSEKTKGKKLKDLTAENVQTIRNWSALQLKNNPAPKDAFYYKATIANIDLHLRQTAKPPVNHAPGADNPPPPSPEDQPFPEEDLDQREMSFDPAELVIPPRLAAQLDLIPDNLGVPMKKLPEKVIRELLRHVETYMSPPPDNFHELLELSTGIRQFLSSVGVKP